MPYANLPTHLKQRYQTAQRIIMRNRRESDYVKRRLFFEGILPFDKLPKSMQKQVKVRREHAARNGQMKNSGRLRGRSQLRICDKRSSTVHSRVQSTHLSLNYSTDNESSVEERLPMNMGAAARSVDDQTLPTQVVRRTEVKSIPGSKDASPKSAPGLGAQLRGELDPTEGVSCLVDGETDEDGIQPHHGQSVTIEPMGNAPGRNGRTESNSHSRDETGEPLDHSTGESVPQEERLFRRWQLNELVHEIDNLKVHRDVLHQEINELHEQKGALLTEVVSMEDIMDELREVKKRLGEVTKERDEREVSSNYWQNRLQRHYDHMQKVLADGPTEEEAKILDSE